MKKSRADWKREAHDLRRNLKIVRDMLQEGRVEAAIAAADVAIGPTAERVEMEPSTEPRTRGTSRATTSARGARTRCRGPSRRRKSTSS